MSSRSSSNPRDPPRPSSASSAATLVHRSLVFDGSVPLCIRLSSTAQASFAKDRSIDCFYLQAHRISYLPVILPEIRKYLLELALDDAALSSLSDDQIWFEVDDVPLRWHWPIGLIYDYYMAAKPSTSTKARPLEISIHVSNPPLDKLLLGPSIESCRTNFMNMVKEADFVRWGSTRRVTQLRKVDQDALWEGVIHHDFDKFWSVASKLVPSPAAPSTPLSGARPISPSAVPSTLTTDGRLPDANAMRSVPVRIYLPDDAPVLQDIVPPLSTEGFPSTVYSILSNIIPLIFPPRPVDMSQSFVATKPLGKVFAQGISIPLDAEIGFLASTMVSADGWLHLVISLASG